MTERGIWDVVTCIGPADEPLLPLFLSSLRHLSPRYIHVITTGKIIYEHYPKHDATQVNWIDEREFPFSMDDIQRWFQSPTRSGWYLQQLLKLYAPLVLSNLSEKFIYVDADVRLHRPLRFFQEDPKETVLFNVGTEFHPPYFQHMDRLLGLSKISVVSGICHIMPMKRRFVQQFHEAITQRHGIPVWMAFLAMVDPREYPTSGASEYELLFTFALTHFPEEVTIRPLLWQNTSSPTSDFRFDYEAWHCYLR